MVGPGFGRGGRGRGQTEPENRDDAERLAEHGADLRRLLLYYVPPRGGSMPAERLLAVVPASDTIRVLKPGQMSRRRGLREVSAMHGPQGDSACVVHSGYQDWPPS